VLPTSLLLAPLWQNRGRVLVAVLAIALGVALGYAIQLINRSAIGEFTHALQTFAGQADLTVRGPRAGFDEALYPRIAELPEVAAASPMVEVQATVVGEQDPLRIVGIDIFRAAQVQPLLLPEGRQRLDVLRDDTVFLSGAASEWLGAKIGSSITLQVGLQAVKLRAAGSLPPGATRARLGVMDIGAAQWRLGRLGQLTRIDVKLRPGVSVEAGQAALQPLLPAGLVVERPEAGVRTTTNMTRAYRVNLNVLALVALFTGGLLVFSTQALSVVRRRAQLALLRVVGVTRRGLVGLLLLEGALVGVAGAIVGLLLGYVIAALVLQFVGADLGAGQFRGLVATPRVEPVGLAIFFLLGVAAAVLGSLFPALEAARSAPARALKAGDDVRVFARLGAAWPGVTVVLVGGCLTQLPPVAELPLFGYVAIALLLVGTIMLMPRAMTLLLRLLPPLGPPPVALAQAQLVNAPGPATTSLAAIVAAVSLTVSMAIMVASFRQSVEHWLDQVLPADLYVRAGGLGDTVYLSPQDQQRIRALPGVQRAQFLRTQQVVLDPARAPITVIVRDIDPTHPGDVLPLVGDTAAVSGSAAPAAWISEPLVDVFGKRVGQVIELPLGGKLVRFTVAGVWRDYARQNGAVVIERDAYVRATGDRTVTDAGLWLQPGTDVRALGERLRATMPGGERLDIAQPAEIRALSLRIFDRSFAATYALEAAAIVIGLFGLSSSLASRVLARRRELGMLRHLGMTRGQVTAMLTAEGVLTSCVGLVVGLALGWAISLVLIHVVNRQSFHWGMTLHVPWLGLLGFGALMLALATLAAAWTSRHATRGDLVRSVREDW
jgi:putative ABC transport system permease protein